MQTYSSQQARIDKFKGAILRHATPREVLSKMGRQVRMPQNNSKTYVARRWLPYGATSTDANTINRFFADANGDRGNVMVQAHQTQEGVTPPPDSITAQDYSVVIQQYSCLYGFTDQTYDMYEDDVPEAMSKQIGERVNLVNEMIIYGALRACTNQYFGGTGTTIATVNGALTLNLVRKIAQGLMANHADMMNTVLKPSQNFATEAVPPGFTVVCHTDLEPDIRDMPNFTPAERYASGTPMMNEIGAVERFRFITTPDLPSLQNAGAAQGSTGLYCTTSTTAVDVYPVIVFGQDAWSQIAIRGIGALDTTFILPSEKSKSDPHGQRGYSGAKWYKAVLLENQGWMAIANVGRKAL
jgi:N4-gp56 family major capsid protein